jgi:hypothetical protein
LGAWLINIAALLAVLVSSLALAYAVLFAQYRIRPRNSSGL